MEMTKYELCIRACRCAVDSVIAEGSIMFMTEEGQTIAWDDVMKWLNSEQEHANFLKTM